MAPFAVTATRKLTSIHSFHSFSKSVLILQWKINKIAGIRSLTLVDGLGHGDSDPQAVGSLGAVGGGQVLTVGELQPLEDERVGAGDDVLRLTQVVFQDLTLVFAQVTRLVDAGAAVARGEGKVAEGGDGELGAAVGQVVGRPDHGEGGWRHKQHTHRTQRSWKQMKQDEFLRR